MRKVLVPVAVLVTACALSACQPAASSGGKLTIVASFYPLQYVAQRIAGDHATVTNLTNPGAEPHDVELTVKQVADVATADVVFYEKGLAPAVDQAVANDASKVVVDTVTAVPLHPPVPGETVPGDTEMDAGDPHFWQDPTLLAKVAAQFERALAKADRAHAADYRRNLGSLQADLANLDTTYRQGLAHCKIHAIVVSHDAFEYLGRRYGLKILPIAGLSPEAEPSVKHIAQLQQLVRSDHVTTVFSEVLASPKMSQTLASDLGLKTAVLDPIEGLSSSDAHANYLSIMKANLAAIERANSCT